MYRRNVDTRDELLRLITDVIVRIKEHQNALRLEIRHVLTRVAECNEADGETFENVLY